jgi:hypothetical protein
MKITRQRSFWSHNVAIIAGVVIALTLGIAPQCRAQDVMSPIEDYFANWFVRSDAAKAEQPHWITPLVTVTPRLEQEFRYDQYFQAMHQGASTINFGGGKGLELIPWDRVEVILGVPAYSAFEAQGKAGVAGRGSDSFGDWTALVKYRLLSANEENGNYILTLFMGFSAPTGNDGNSEGHAMYTPTIAFGKGWGDFDFQSTVGVAFPDGGLDRLGMPLTYNTAFQYRIAKVVWPELEVNYTWYPDGEHTGKNQVYLTPGVVIGRLPLIGRLGATIGAGMQVAVSTYAHYHNEWILTARIPF